MIKVNYVSDLHIEFGEFPEAKEMSGDVLVIAGDTCPIYKEKLYMPLLETFSDSFKKVIMVAGNHEYYNGNTLDIKDLYDNVAGFGNIHLLEDDHVYVWDEETKSNVVFIGATLWSDIDIMHENAIRSMMNDFHIIRHLTRRFQPSDAARKFKNSSDYIWEVLRNTNNITKIVVTHHAPSFKSIDNTYRDSMLNSAYASDLEVFMEEDYAPDFWIHGHMHNTNNYIVGNTNVITNPRGYVKYEVNPKFDPFKYVEVHGK